MCKQKYLNISLEVREIRDKFLDLWHETSEYDWW